MQTYPPRTPAELRVMDNTGRSPGTEYIAWHWILRVFRLHKFDPVAFPASKRLVVLIEAIPSSDVSVHKHTWMRFSGNVSVYFVGRCPACDYDLGDEAERPGTWLAKKTQALFADAAKRFPSTDFVMKMDMDTYLVPENLYETLASLNASRPWVLGTWINHPGGAFPHGGAGYVVSREMLRRANGTNACPVVGPNEDVFVGRCTSSTGASLVNSEALEHRTIPWVFARGAGLIRPHLITTHRYKDPLEYAGLHLVFRAFRGG